MHKFASQIALLIVGGILFVLIIGGTLATPAYSQSGRPTHTPTTTPLSSLTLPDWVNDPEANIISVSASQDNRLCCDHEALLNVTTGEQFIIDPPYPIFVNWLTTDEGVFLSFTRNSGSASDGFYELVNIETGELTRYALHDPDLPRVQPITNLTQTNGAGVSFHLSTEHNLVSHDTDTYQIETITQIVLDNPSEQVYKTIAYYRNIDDLTVKWVGAGQYITISYSSLEKSDPRSGVNEDRLVTRAVTFNTLGERRSSIAVLGDKSSIQWAPGTRPQFIYRSTDKTICLAEIDGEGRDCDSIPAWESEQHSTVTEYGWSQDGQQIILLYRRDDDNLRGGLCLFDIESSTIDCPLEEEVVSGTFGSTYLYQAPSNYGIFRYFSIVEENMYTQPPRQTGICYLNQTTYAVDCLADDLIPTGSYYRRASLAPNGATLLLIHSTYADYPPYEGLCLFNLKTTSMKCPPMPDGLRYINNISWSADSKFMVITYNGVAPGGDDASFVEYAVVDVQAETVTRGGYGIFGYWRPPIGD